MPTWNTKNYQRVQDSRWMPGPVGRECHWHLQVPDHRTAGRATRSSAWIRRYVTSHRGTVTVVLPVVVTIPGERSPLAAAARLWTPGPGHWQGAARVMNTTVPIMLLVMGTSWPLKSRCQWGGDGHPAVAGGNASGQCAARQPERLCPAGQWL